tara:strand:- start:319 stop:525 length:207 start_codon:yes stop_codon:yes gene_type:complete
MNSKLHTVTDPLGRAMRLFLTVDQRDYVGARALLESLPSFKQRWSWFLGQLFAVITSSIGFMSGGSAT